MVSAEPITSLLDRLVKRCKFKVGQILSDFIVAGGLLELAVGARRVVDPFAREIVGLGDGLGRLLNRDFFGLGHGQNDWVRLGVLPHHPEEETRQVDRVDELAPRLSSAPDDERLVFLGARV